MRHKAGENDFRIVLYFRRINQEARIAGSSQPVTHIGQLKHGLNTMI